MVTHKPANQFGSYTSQKQGTPNEGDGKRDVTILKRGGEKGTGRVHGLHGANGA